MNTLNSIWAFADTTISTRQLMKLWSQISYVTIDPTGPAAFVDTWSRAMRVRVPKTIAHQAQDIQVTTAAPSALNYVSRLR